MTESNVTAGGASRAGVHGADGPGVPGATGAGTMPPARFSAQARLRALQADIMELILERELDAARPGHLGPPGDAPPLREAPRIALEARGGADGERKTITAMFADLKGSTALIEGLDPEEARAIIDPALQLMMDAVHRYEGYVAQAFKYAATSSYRPRRARRPQ